MAERQQRQRLRALRNDRNLARLIVNGISTGKQLGTGSYGSVEEIEVNGLICAGKKIHDILIDAANAGVENVAGKYVQECQLMSDLRHPNITLFLGVCFLPDCQLPVLLMERLDGSLDDLLETVPNIPVTLKRSILEDITRGLLYLHKHTPQIIHRDLTAKNVLLTASFVAKITDFGNSRIVNLQPGQLARTLSRLPGTMLYMPPEALEASSRYGPSLDIFSFGHLALFVGLQVFPENLLQHTYADPDDPDRLIGRSEVGRRQAYFDQLEDLLPGGVRHLFIQMIKDCLRNDPTQRLTAEQLVTALEGMKDIVEGPYGELATVDAMRQVRTMKALKSKSEDNVNELAAKEEEIQQLQRQFEATYEQYEVELRQKNEEIQQKDTQLQQFQVDIRRVQADLQQKATMMQQKDTQLEQLTTQLREKDVRLRQREEELQWNGAQLRQKDEELQQRERELTNKLREKDIRLRQREEELQRKGAQLQQKDEELQQRNADIIRLQIEIQRLQTQLSELKLPLNLKWRRGKDSPFGRWTYPQAVLFKKQLYIGGGSASSSREAQTVVVYDPDLDSYNTLTPYAYILFSMAIINNQLVLVGGEEVQTDKKTNKLGLWNEQSKRWTHPLPPMTTACNAPAVATHNNRWLVVIGGYSSENYLSRVEILDTSEPGQWHHAASLPRSCYYAVPATIGNMCYLLGGFTAGGVPSSKVFSVCLDDLISQAISQPASASAPPTPSPWQSLPDTPLTCSTALAFNGALLAVGGSTYIYEGSKAIYHYQPSSRSWIKAGELPTGRSQCACIVLPSGNLFVASGDYHRARVDITSSIV